MHTFARRQNQPQHQSADGPARPHMAGRGPSRHEHPLLRLQRTIGNRAVLRLLRAHAEGLDAEPAASASTHPAHDSGPTPSVAARAKLAVGEPGDEYEQEADRVSAQVMRVSEPRVQRACACGGECPSCQTNQTAEGDEPLRTKRDHGGATARSAPPAVHDALASPGRPLDSSTRAFMEGRFGHDFGRVRVHTDARAAESARAVDALAYTVGADIVFGAGQYAPSTSAGRALLAHELTHVLQGGGAGGPLRRKPAPKEACPKREPGEVKASAGEPFKFLELKPKQEWLIYGFGVGSSAADPAKGDVAEMIDRITWLLTQGHFFYVVGEDPVEVLGYSDCHVDKNNPNERLRGDRADEVCDAYKRKWLAEEGSAAAYDRFITSCRPAPVNEYVTTNATKEGRAMNRGVLVRVVPKRAAPKTSAFPYDETYGPTEANCLTYKATEDFLSPVYANNAYCACTHTPDEPHNNCVRDCLQVKMWPFIAANAAALRSGKAPDVTDFIWCAAIWKHHKDCYAECGCDNSFITFEGFLPVCQVKLTCPAIGLLIATLNNCMNP